MPVATKNPDCRRDRQRARILAAIQAEALTSQQLADKLHLSRSGVQLHLTVMTAETPRLVHIASYTPAGYRKKGGPMYLAGDKKDAEYPKARRAKGRVTVEQQKARILKLLGTRQMTVAEVADEMLLRRARIYMFELREAGKIHIAGWRSHPSAYPSPIYAIGGAPDVARPAALTESEKCSRHWAKLKADPHRHGLHLLRARVRRKPQNPFSALGL
jgi:hypothetical protein